MAIEDILTLPETFTVDGKEYKAEFDCTSYGILEQMTGKSIYKIQDLIADNNLFMTDSIEVICASLIKHHTDKEINDFREYLKNNLSTITLINFPIVQAFFKGIAPPEIFKKVQEIQGTLKNKDDKKKEDKTKV